jgi:methionine-rich copper-binding protein CopC
MDGSTLTAASFTVKPTGGANIAGSVSYSGTTATFTPNAALSQGVEYTATVASTVRDVEGNQMGSAYSWTFKTVPDTTPPSITNRTPADGATNVATNTTVTATFSEPIKTSTVDGTSFRVADPGNTAVAGSFSFNGNTVTFTPSGGLNGQTEYTVSLSTGIQDLAGNPLSSATSWSFTTELPFLSCTSQAAVTSSAGDNNGYQTSPANACQDGSGAAVDTNSGTSTTTSCTSTAKDKHVFSNFNADVNSGATINGIEVRLDGWADSTSSSPRFCVQLSWNGGSSWTTAKQTSTLSTSERTYILGSTSDNWGRTWSSSNFSNANFRVRVIDVSSSTSRDFSLDWVAVRVTSTGGTSLEADTTPPTVDSTSPANGASGVAVSSNVSATFSEAMDAGTLSSASFTVHPTSGGANLGGSVSYTGNTATFDPASNLAAGTSYTASIAGTATDAAGNAIGADYSWTFTTAAAAGDTTKPTLTGMSPANGASGVATNATIQATFSEPMNSSSVTASGRFSVKTTSGGVNVAGTVTYSNNVATFTPSSALTAGTSYTVTLSTAMTDVAGNTLTAPGTWTFTTASGATACTAPTITSHTDTNASGSGTVSFAWNAVPGASTYRIERQSFSSWTTVTTTSSTSYSGSDSFMDPNWRVSVASGTCTPVPGPATTFDP